MLSIIIKVRKLIGPNQKRLLSIVDPSSTINYAHDEEAIAFINESYNSLSCKTIQEKINNLTSRIRTPESLHRFGFENAPFQLDESFKDQFLYSTAMYLQKDMINPPHLGTFNGIVAFNKNGVRISTFFEESLAKSLAVYAKANFISLDVWDTFDWNRIKENRKSKSIDYKSNKLHKNDTKSTKQNNGSINHPQQESKDISNQITDSKLPCVISEEEEQLIKENKQNPIKISHPLPVKIIDARLPIREQDDPNKFTQIIQLPDIFNIAKRIALIRENLDSYDSLIRIIEVISLNCDKNVPLIIFVRHFKKLIEGMNINNLVKKLNVLREIVPIVVVGSSDCSSSNGRYLTSEGESDDQFYDYNSLKEYNFNEFHSYFTSIDIREPKEKDVWKKIENCEWKLKYLSENHFQFSKIIKSMMVNKDTSDFLFLNLPNFTLDYHNAEKVIGWAVAYEMNQSSYKVPINEVTIKSQSIQKGLDLLFYNKDILEEKEKFFHNASGETETSSTTKDNRTDLNSYESALLTNLYPPGKMGITYSDVGSHETLKEALHELVALPIQRSDLFKKGLLSKSISGILLFGPPGTGKTLLAKALATESGCHFLYIKMSNVLDMYIGESEKNAKAVFSLARKYAPCVIFMDEVDSIFSRRTSDERSTFKRDVLNEIMSEWDGISSGDSRVVVVGATNRPFDLDDAVLRRLPRRLLVDIPDTIGRAKILQVLLKEENIQEDVSFETIAQKTKGYTGSDLKNVCLAAAMNSVKRFIELEKQQSAPESPSITNEDVENALKNSKSSVSEDSLVTKKLRDWNDQYGLGMNSKKNPFGFFNLINEDTPKVKAHLFSKEDS